MALLTLIRVSRQLFKGADASAKITGLLEKETHPHVHRTFYRVAILVYVEHIAVSLHHGLEIEGGITAAATMVELIAHVCGG